MNATVTIKAKNQQTVFTTVTMRTLHAPTLSAILKIKMYTKELTPKNGENGKCKLSQLGSLYKKNLQPHDQHVKRQQDNDSVLQQAPSYMYKKNLQPHD